MTRSFFILLSACITARSKRFATLLVERSNQYRPIYRLSRRKYQRDTTFIDMPARLEFFTDEFRSNFSFWGWDFIDVFADYLFRLAYFLPQWTLLSIDNGIFFAAAHLKLLHLLHTMNELLV